MKRIVVCDSGLGGLNVVARFFNGNNDAEQCDIVYFNAYPSAETGFNKLKSNRDQEEVLRDVFEGMKQFGPDLCLIACNTLSIIHERLSLWYAPPFPVAGIIDAAVGGMWQALLDYPDSAMLILGTKSTVESGVYQNRLIEKGISSDRICSLGCPGLATLLESDPAAPEVEKSISEYAEQASSLWEKKPAKLFLGLCCTHFGFAKQIWKQKFTEIFGNNTDIVNPNELLAADCSAANFSYHSRIDFFPGARENMSGYFRNSAPAISNALLKAMPESGLFMFNKGN